VGDCHQLHALPPLLSNCAGTIDYLTRRWCCATISPVLFAISMSQVWFIAAEMQTLLCVANASSDESCCCSTHKSWPSSRSLNLGSV
jgi:hypothetical protein